MAVTIEQQAGVNIVTSGNPIVWVFSSNQTAQTNFSYYVEVYVNYTLNSSHQVFPESGIYGKFDASEIAESVLSAPTIPTVITGVNANNFIDIYLLVYERYGTTPTLHAFNNTTQPYCFKAKLFLNDWINTDIEDYYIDDTNGNKKFLTACPEFTLRNGEEQKLYFIADAAEDGMTIHLNYKDSTGSSLNTESISASGYIVTGIAVDWDILDGYYSLDNVATVEVYVETDADSFISETITINIDNSCAEYTARLHFLNQLGGVDAFTFTQVGRYNATTETQSFLTTQGAFNGSSFEWDGLNSQVNNYQVGVNRKLKIESGWITADVQEWLNNNLFTSPYVLLETSNGLLRVANMSTSVTYNRSKTDMLFNTVIEIDELHHTSMIV